jgi:hypothetical protein
MFDIWSSLAELRQPCLYRRLDSRFIGPDDLVRKDVLASLDRQLCEHLAAGRASFQAPPMPLSIPLEHRFLATSALQKCIRRGDADGAMRFAQQGCALDIEHTFRRLATCAVEDVGIGNLLAVAMALAVMGDRRMRHNGAPEELAAYLAYLLAVSPKSRLACDLLSICDYDRRLRSLKADLAQSPSSRLRTVAEDRANPIAERMTAAWMLAGPSRFRGTTMPAISRSRDEIMRMMAAARMPLLLYYVADRCAARLSDAMFVSGYFVAEMMEADPEIEVGREPQTEMAMIAGYPAAAYDLHVSVGRLALNRFGRECPEIVRLLQPVSTGSRDTVVRHGVFIAEGGKLAVRLRFAKADAIEREAHFVELSFAGISDPSDRCVFVTTIRAQMPTLNRIRADLMPGV